MSPSIGLGKKQLLNPSRSISPRLRGEQERPAPPRGRSGQVHLICSCLQANLQAGCKSEGLFSLWGQTPHVSFISSSVDGTGWPPPLCSRPSRQTYLAATLSRFLPRAPSDSLISSLGLDLALLGDSGHGMWESVLQGYHPHPLPTPQGNLPSLFSFRRST